MKLIDATKGEEYIIDKVETNNDELNSFLFSLGCYSGESIILINKNNGGCVVVIKDSRYNFDNHLSSLIEISIKNKDEINVKIKKTNF